MLNLHGISRAAFDLIVSEEVTSQQVYNKRYRAPEWPGVNSGVTIGIGYDVGQNTKTQLWNDWKGKIPDGMIRALEKCCGVTGSAAAPLARRLRGVVDVPWDVALDVFSNASLPRYVALARRKLPGFDELSPDCKGALASLVFNRGGSFDLPGDRYVEMRAIKACMASGDLTKVPALIREMKRLWAPTSGLRSRRDREAALFERGLAAARHGFLPATEDDDSAGRSAREEERGAELIEDQHGADMQTVMLVQRRLRELGYYDVGKIDGELVPKGRTEAAILAFRNENGLPLTPTVDDDLLNALLVADHRHIGEERATATADDLRDEGSETIAMTDRIKRWAGRTFGAGGAGGLFGGMAWATDRLSTVTGFRDAVDGLGLSREAIALIIALIVASIVVAVFGLVIWAIAQRVESRRVFDFRKGKNT